MFAGGPLMGWQQLVADVAGEVLEDGSHAYDEVIVVVGRRAGKTRLVHGVQLRRGIRAVANPIHHPITGRRVPYLAASTAQNMTAATRRLRETWDFYRTAVGRQASQRSRLLRGVNHAAIELDYRRRVRTPTGGQAWDLNPWASRLSVFPPTASAVRGDEYLMLNVDEVLVLSAADGQDILEAASPTLATFAGLAQMWWTSNEAKGSGGWLYQLKRRGRAAAESGATTGTAYFEWSMAPDEDPEDPAVWHRAHPAVGHVLTEAVMRRELEKLGVDAFAREYLGLETPDTADGSSAMDLDRWDACAPTPWPGVPTTAPALYVAVDQDPDRTLAVICITAQLPDGTVLLEVAHEQPRPRQAQLVEHLRRMVQAHPTIAAIGYDPRTCASLGEALAAAGLPAEPVAGQRAAQAYADLVTVMAEDRLAHSGDPLVREHWQAAIRRPYGDGGHVLSRRTSAAPIAGAVAATTAVHLAAAPEAATPQIW